MFMMNLANSIYNNFRNSRFGYNNNNNNNNKHNFDIDRKDFVNYDMTNYMMESNNKANKLYNKLNSSSVLLTKILRRDVDLKIETDIEYDHNNETIICHKHKKRSNDFIRKNGFEFVLVFIFGVLAHFHFQRSHR